MRTREDERLAGEAVLGGRVRNERRGNSANSNRGRGGVGDQEKRVQSGGFGVVEERGKSC